MNKNIVQALIIVLILLVPVVFLVIKGTEINSMQLIPLSAIIVIGIIYLFLGMKKKQNIKDGIANDDEMSKMVHLKSSTLTFQLSFIVWFFIIVFFFKGNSALYRPIFIGMAIILLMYYIIKTHYSHKGIK